jgi:hypothetical protein
MFLIDLFGAAPITRSAFNNIHGSSAELIVYFIPVKPDAKPEDHLLSATCPCRVSSDDNICHQPNRGNSFSSGNTPGTSKSHIPS